LCQTQAQNPLAANNYYMEDYWGYMGLLTPSTTF